VTILVTGAAGFVGSHLIHALGADGERVVGLDNYNDYYSPELKKMRVKALIPSTIEVIEADLTNPRFIFEIISELRPKTIYHLAAQAGVRLDIDKNDLYVQSNLVGFSNILQASIKFRVKNFIYASSSSVYGNSNNVPYSENDHNLLPISFYGASKLSNEFLAAALVRGTSTSARGLRFFTVYGPWGRPDMAYLRLAETLINDHEFNLFGTGDAVRDFTYIDDTIHATIALGKQLDESNLLGFADVVNIGGGKPSSMLELINAFENVSQKTLRVNHLNRVEKDVNQTIADSKKLEMLTSFKPKIGLLEGVEQVFNWATSSNVSAKLESWTKSVN
jgi:UDP-glucuronate 4-epimerase